VVQGTLRHFILFLFYFVKRISSSGLEPMVMAQSITADPNPMDQPTDGDAFLTKR
jgi:hypothetical protein